MLLLVERSLLCVCVLLGQLDLMVPLMKLMHQWLSLCLQADAFEQTCPNNDKVLGQIYSWRHSQKMFFARCARATPWHAHYAEAPLPTGCWSSRPLQAKPTRCQTR
jgi:hypothetical protein